MIDYSLILCTNYAGKAWSVGETYDSLQWLDESPKPSQSDLDSQWDAVKTKISARAYISKRQAEYPPIGDQLDALWKGGEAAAEMTAKIQAVKDKYPKGNTL
jgi:hypothetical protein